ncbi:MAG TPA: YkuS family protein [Firmicutes bacterium]|nr:YkuS family protein [Bacillota bacterium]
MGRRVAVEEQLTPVKEYLQARGYQVVELRPHVEADAVVVSGQNENMLGGHTIATTGPVINAEGMTPEEVYRQLEGRPRAPAE